MHLRASADQYDIRGLRRLPEYITSPLESSNRRGYVPSSDTRTVGPSRRSSATRQAPSVSVASAGRTPTRFGITRKLKRCSIG